MPTPAGIERQRQRPQSSPPRPPLHAGHTITADNAFRRSVSLGVNQTAGTRLTPTFAALRIEGEFISQRSAAMTTYRSDSDADFACLEQYLAGGAFGTLADLSLHKWEQNPQQLIHLIQKFAEDMPWASEEANRVAQTLSNKLELPTRYDSPSQYLILEKLVGRVREAARSLQFQTEDFPHFACIPTGLVNASAVSLPCSSRPFLLFDSQLLLYCHLFAKAFANCLPIVDRRDGMTSFSTDAKLVSERIEAAPEIVERLNELLHAYVAAGSPHKSTQYHPHKDYVHLIEVLRDGMALFVVAHEFGHVHSGHLGAFLQRFQVKSEAFDCENDNHRQEHEADVVGLILTMKAMADSGYDAAMSYIGIELFFISMEMASRSEHIFRFGHDDDYRDSASASHPANSDRRSVLNITLETFIESKEQVEGARSMAAKYNEISWILWKYAQATNSSSKRANPD